MGQAGSKLNAYRRNRPRRKQVNVHPSHGCFKNDPLSITWSQEDCIDKDIVWFCHIAPRPHRRRHWLGYMKSHEVTRDNHQQLRWTVLVVIGFFMLPFAVIRWSFGELCRFTHFWTHFEFCCAFVKTVSVLAKPVHKNSAITYWNNANK